MKDYIRQALNEEVLGNNETNNFYINNGIDGDSLSYLGQGDYGEAYSIGDGRVLKITTSKNEFNLAKEILNNPLGIYKTAFAEFFAAEIVDGKMMIIMEELDVDSAIENLFYELDDYLSEQGLPIQYVDNLDTDELELSDEMESFIGDISNIIRAYRYLGVEASDIRPENMGYSKNGEVKAFDIDDKRRN